MKSRDPLPASSKTASKILFIRLSSLGDIVLATAALSKLPTGRRADWLCGSPYRELLKGHPQINQVWEFNKSSGLVGWISLCLQLRSQNYTQVYDLHNNLRTRVARLIFLFSSSRWQSISKQRVRLTGAFVFKKWWPQFAWPTPWVDRYAQQLDGTGPGLPDFKYLVARSVQEVDHEPRFSEFIKWASNHPYTCIMPSSLWRGKCWPVDHWVKYIEQTQGHFVVLGTLNDLASLQLIDATLPRLQSRVWNGVGQWSIQETAYVLQKSNSYLGSDTGLAHLAEAVGVPAAIIFGPTVPQLGFGPWRPESRSISTDLWCRPCSKDGRGCFRPSQKFLCLTALTPAEVSRQLRQSKTGVIP